MSLSRLISDFRSPPKRYRGAPFWSWNGRLELNELRRQVHVLERMGMGGCFMHSRTGLVTEYLGEEWFRLINACADEAESLGMEAWLYDEDRWPSGTAGGLVTEDRRLRMRYVRMDEIGPDGLIWSDNVLAAFSVRREELAVYDVQRLSRGQAPTLTPGKAVLVFTVVEAECSSNYNGQTYVDTMNAEATERFIELTHERYAQHCGARLGRSIKGIFTDEPHRGALMDQFGGEGDRSARQVPWTPGLLERFRDAFGYDLTDHLPELFLHQNGEPVSQVKWHYVELLMRLFLEGFARPYAAWCRERGLEVTGHVLHEDSLSAQTAMCGSVMRYYEHMDCPGIDLLTEGNRAYWVAKQLQSAARQTGQRRLLSELYGCTGWQMPFSGHKAVGDWQALFGINLRCHHLSWYTMEGEAKRDFPASIFHQSAWWPVYPYVEDYFSRLGLLMDQGERVCRLLVIHPVESVWCQVHAGWSRYLGATSERIAALERSFGKLFHWLQGAQLDFDYADEAMLARLGAVGQNGELQVGHGSYGAIVVGGMATIRSSTIDLLRRASDAGIPVIYAGEPPTHMDALRSDVPSRHAQTVGSVPWDREAVVNACEKAVGRAVRVTAGAAARPADSVFCQVRRDDDGRVLAMVLNTDRDRGVPQARISLRGSGVAEQWDCRTGERQVVPHTIEDGWVTIQTDLEPAGERVYVIDPVPTEPKAATVEWREVERRRLAGPFAYRLSEPNVCVLDRCEYRVGDNEWLGPCEVLKADRAVRAQFGVPPRGGLMLQPWFAAREHRGPLGQVSVRFRFEVERLPDGPVDVAVERLDIFGVAANGMPIRREAPPRHWIDVCFERLRLPSGCLRLGENEIELTGSYYDTMGLEAIYLLGEFGVRVEDGGAVLTGLPAQLAVGDVAAQGLPFYSGAIAYRVNLGSPSGGDHQEAQVALHTPGLSGACAVVAPADARLHDASSLDLSTVPPYSEPGCVIAWEPYEADVTNMAGGDGCLDLLIYLTRRNTFGPLHQVPVQAPGYGPENWVTEGAAFSEDYVLWPSGLLQAPEIIIREA